MKNILFSILIFLNLNVFGQHYIPYFRAVAAAETAITDSNFTTALQIYHTQFHQYDFIFPKDAYIASQVAIATKNDTLSEFFIYRGISCGMDSFILKKNPHTNLWWQANAGKKMSPVIYDSLHRIYESRINTQYKKQMAMLIRKDQKLRNRNETYLNAVVFNHKLKPRLFKKWMRQADSQSLQILRYTLQYGFPGHRIIGCNDARYFKKFGTSIRCTYATVILFHANHAWQYLEKELPAQLEAGNITPKQYALLRDFATRHTITGNLKDTAFPDYVYFVRWKNNVLEPDNIYRVQRVLDIAYKIDTINKARAEICLPDYQTGIKMESMEKQFFRENWSQRNANCLLFDFCYYEWD